jgi:quercetin dioxygenase-like cupin family protein
MKRIIVNPLFRDEVKFVRTSAESGGEISEMEIILQAGGKNPMHYHRSYSETFAPLDGEVGVGLGRNETKILKPGESHTVEPNTLHYWFNPSGREIKFRIEIKPGHEGFENSLRILYGMAADGLTDKKGIPRSIKDLALVANMSDMNIPGFFTLIFPVLKLIAKRAIRSGYEQELINRYCL